MRPKVMIIRPGAMGDTLMLMPAMIRLGESADIICVGRYPGLDYLRPYTDACLDYEGHGWHGLYMEDDTRPPPCVTHEIHRVIAFLSNPDKRARDHLHSWFPKAHIQMFPPFPQENRTIHTAEFIARCIQETGLPVDAKRCIHGALKTPLMPFRGGKRASMNIVFHPGSGGISKNYSPEFWMELVKQVYRDLFEERGKILLLLGPAEERLSDYFMDRGEGLGIKILSCPEKDELLETLGTTGLYLGHDSGVTHLAAMMGTPVIALFRESSILQWRPLGPSVAVIERDDNESRLIKKIIRNSMNLYHMKS